MAVILSYDNPDQKQVHQEVYQAAKTEIPAAQFRLLTDSSNKYRNTVFRDPGQLSNILPVYVIKPLYTYGSYVFYKLGIPLVKSTAILSIISYLLIGLLLLYWLLLYYDPLYSVLLSTLIMCMPFMLSSIGLSTPDMVSALIIFAAAFLLLEKKHATASGLLLILSILARIDNIIPVLVIFSGLHFLKRPFLSRIKYFALCGGAILLFFLAVLPATSYGWSHFYFTSFIDNMKDNSASALKTTEYTKPLLFQLWEGLHSSHILLLFFLAALYLYPNRSFKKEAVDLPALFVLLILVTIIIRFFMQPLIIDRFYLAYYLVTYVVFLKHFSRRGTSIV